VAFSSIQLIVCACCRKYIDALYDSNTMRFLVDTFLYLTKIPFIISHLPKWDISGG